MTTLPTHQRVLDLFHYDSETGVFTNKIKRNPKAPEGALAGYINNLGYSVIQVDKKKIHAHRLAWFYVTGEWPPHQIDHINRNRSDNKFSNLRLATSEQNNHNTTDRTNNTSGHRGVVWHKKRQKWQAQISINNKHKYLGLFDRIEDAIAARQAAVNEFHHFAVKE